MVDPGALASECMALLCLVPWIVAVEICSDPLLPIVSGLVVKSDGPPHPLGPKRRVLNSDSIRSLVFVVRAGRNVADSRLV